MDFNDRAGTNPFAAPKAHSAGENFRPRQADDDVLPYESRTSSSTRRASAWRLKGRVLPLSAGTIGSLFDPS